MVRVCLLLPLAAIGLAALSPSQAGLLAPVNAPKSAANGRLSLKSHHTRTHSSLGLRLRGGSDKGADQSKGLPEVNIANIAKFNNWDHRECSVENAQEWRDYMSTFLDNFKGDATVIPKKIHQIWIGPKQPPIVWIDTWRKKYRAQYPGWDYKLWTDKEVGEIELRNQDIYDQERMYQCKADILRLEVLWREGGIYVDADMVWLHKDLQDVLDLCEKTGFFCGYEPDTKDKPYSVIGNSFIACTPKHPLVDMLIKYIQGVYPHKRPYHGVEWVTGPLAFTKCISHTQVWFYPKFHYVPNPDAINLNDFPDSYAFQFGYTCSGLEGWVANSIRRCTLDNFWLDKCPQLKDLEWPLGKLRPLPEHPDASPKGDIPKVIHQFAFQGAKPARWLESWGRDFCAQNPGWTHKVWTSVAELKSDYFCCNMYSDQAWQMDALAMQLLALEVVYKHGGYHVPVSVAYNKNNQFKSLVQGKLVAASMDPSLDQTAFSQYSLKKGFVDVEGLRIVGSAPESAACLQKIKDLIMLKPDSVGAYLDFPEWTRFLGAEEMFDLCASPASDRAMISWGVLGTLESRFVAVTDPELFHYKSLSDAVPGFIAEMDQQGHWDFILLTLQWEAGEDGNGMYRLQSGQAPPNSRVVGLVCNKGSSRHLPPLEPADDNQKIYDHIFSHHHQLTVGMGTEKFKHDKQLSLIYRAIPSIQHAFKVLANHEPPLDYDAQERNGNNLKCMKNNQVRYELQVDQEHRASFRAFNEDGGMNCEIRLQQGHAGTRVEFIKVFFNHALVFEKQNQIC